MGMHSRGEIEEAIEELRRAPCAVGFPIDVLRSVLESLPEDGDGRILIQATVELDPERESGEGPAIDVFVANTPQGEDGLNLILDAGGFASSRTTTNTLPDYIIHPAKKI